MADGKWEMAKGGKGPRDDRTTGRRMEPPLPGPLPHLVAERENGETAEGKGESETTRLRDDGMTG